MKCRILRQPWPKLFMDYLYWRNLQDPDLIEICPLTLEDLPRASYPEYFLHRADALALLSRAGVSPE